MVEDALAEPGNTGEGLRGVCIREVLRDLKESAKLLIEDKIRQFGLGEADGFRIFRDVIQTPKDGQIIFKGMQDYNAESVKSLERFNRAWTEEAQTLSLRSLTLIRPTIRAKDSELWFSWNPRRKKDAVDHFFRGNGADDGEQWEKPPRSAIVKANWRDNPWFPEDLKTEREYDFRVYPERYAHIWEGDYAKAFEGAYYARLLNEARAQDRIKFIPADSIVPYRAFWDLGGAGAQADAMAIWIIQWIGHEIRVLDYIEGVGQTLSYYVNELRSRKLHPVCYLPHDGINANNITGKRYRDHLEDAGFETVVIPNQGRGAAMQRIEATRRILPFCVFNENTTEAGRDALGFYHEKKDEQRNVGLGPDHDWSSHCADAFGLMAVCYEGPQGPMTVDSLFESRLIEVDRSEVTGY